MSIFSPNRLHASASAKRWCKFMAKIRIPEAAVPALQIIATLDDGNFSALIAVFTRAKPTLKPWQFLDQIDSGDIGISERTVAEVFDALIGLYMAKDGHGVSANEMSEDIGEAVLDIENKEFDFKPVKTKLVERLKVLLGFDKSLAVTAKALDVMTEDERTYCEARILSDVRPVFTASLKSPSGAVIIHNLKISFHSNREHEDFYVAMDTDDLKNLKAAIERAEEKTAALESLIEAGKVPYLKP